MNFIALTVKLDEWMIIRTITGPRNSVHLRDGSLFFVKEFGCASRGQMAAIIYTSSCSNYYITKDVTSPQKKKEKDAYI
jgi:hypothetical protein